MEKPYYQDEWVTQYCSDALSVLKELESDSIDLLCTDPPYGLEFMGKEWDAPWKGKASKEFNTSCDGKLGGFKQLPNHSRINNLRCSACGHWKFSSKPCKCENPQFPNAKRMAKQGMKEFVTEWGTACLRVLKPGAFAFVMSSPRQDMLSAMIDGLEDAGFRIDFTPIYWAYASGFPKAQNISLAIDKQECRKQLIEKLGRKPTKEEFQEAWKVFREVVGVSPNDRPQSQVASGMGFDRALDKGQSHKSIEISQPSTPQAKALDGSYGGFQPKPAVEVIIVAMKPLSEKTFTDQALSNGKGITWLDDCRVPYESEGDKAGIIGGISENIFSNKPYEGDILKANPSGRFPANLLISDDVLNDGRKQEGKVGFRASASSIYGTSTMKQTYDSGKAEYGSFSRYFDLDKWAQKTFPFLIVPKASKSEKNKGCEDLEKQMPTWNQGSFQEHGIESGTGRIIPRLPRANIHPTCKPLKLMSYLITLGSRPCDTILDPFGGSGTTALASKLLGRYCIISEIEEKYCEIAARRCQQSVMRLEL